MIFSSWESMFVFKGYLLPYRREKNKSNRKWSKSFILLPDTIFIIQWLNGTIQFQSVIIVKNNFSLSSNFNFVQLLCGYLHNHLKQLAKLESTYFGWMNFQTKISYTCIFLLDASQIYMFLSALLNSLRKLRIFTMHLSA